MFQDEARFGRINKPKYCWCQKGIRPSVPCHHIREYRYAYGAVEPKTGDSFFLIMPYCNSEKNKKKIQSCISDKTKVASNNIYCYGNKDDIEAAHSSGLSIGKYRAYLGLKEKKPDIKPEDVSRLTMREIRDMAKNKSSDNADDCSGVEQQHGNGNGHGNGQGNGNRHGKN